VKVEIWSDIACPWCYIGKRRFEAALARFEHADEVEVVWRSFELDPSAPLERTGDRAERLARKYGMTVARAREIGQQMTQTGAADGIEFHFDSVRSGNTFDGHRLVHLAGEHGLAGATKERLLRANFSEGKVVGDAETLAELGAEVGLDAGEIRAALAGERYADDVRDDEHTAARLGITAVPTFVVDRTLGTSGAHPPEILLELLRQGWERRTPTPQAA
jgi:predicted DsbA family dithiol-disulfide isomerase